jgi:hypothetical protein
MSEFKIYESLVLEEESSTQDPFANTKAKNIADRESNYQAQRTKRELYY